MATNTKGLTIFRNGLVLDSVFWVARQHQKTNVHVLRSFCTWSPHGQPTCSVAGLRSTWSAGVEYPNCDADGPEWSKDTNLCLKNRSQFVGHLAVKICGQSFRRTGIVWTGIVYPNEVLHLQGSFWFVTSLQSAFSAGTLSFSPLLYLKEAQFTFMGNFNIWEHRDSSWEFFLCF